MTKELDASAYVSLLETAGEQISALESSEVDAFNALEKITGTVLKHLPNNPDLLQPAIIMLGHLTEWMKPAEWPKIKKMTKKLLATVDDEPTGGLVSLPLAFLNLASTCSPKYAGLMVDLSETSPDYPHVRQMALQRADRGMKRISSDSKEREQQLEESHNLLFAASKDAGNRPADDKQELAELWLRLAHLADGKVTPIFVDAAEMANNYCQMPSSRGCDSDKWVRVDYLGNLADYAAEIENEPNAQIEHPLAAVVEDAHKINDKLTKDTALKALIGKDAAIRHPGQFS